MKQCKTGTRTLILTATIALLLVLGCGKDSSIASPEEHSFFMRVRVIDDAGSPVPGLRVSTYNHLRPRMWETDKTRESGEVLGRPAVTTMRFAVDDSSEFRLAFFDLEGTNHDSIQGLVSAGVYEVEFAPDTWPKRVAVIECVFQVRDAVTGIDRFSDTIYPVLYDFASDRCLLGYLSPSGVYETTDSLYFPHLFDLPTLHRTFAYSPDILGSFSFTDTVRFTITDINSGASMNIDSVVTHGRNIFTVTWNPTQPSASNDVGEMRSLLQPSPDSIDPPTQLDIYGLPKGNNSTSALKTQPAWSLSQNFPNPFN